MAGVLMADGPVTAVDVVEVVERYGLGLHVGTAVRVLVAAGRTPRSRLIEDLEEAHWWLARCASHGGQARFQPDADAADLMAPTAVCDALRVLGHRRVALLTLLEHAAEGGATDSAARIAAAHVEAAIEAARLFELPKANGGRSA